MIFNTSPPASNNPWEAPSTTDNESPSSILGPRVNNESISHQFDDDFVNNSNNSNNSSNDVTDSKVVEKSSEGSKPFEKLEDSEEYLETLERKLKKLSTPKDKDKSLLKALAERRSDEARRYLVSCHVKFIYLFESCIATAIFINIVQYIHLCVLLTDDYQWLINFYQLGLS